MENISFIQKSNLSFMKNGLIKIWLIYLLIRDFISAKLTLFYPLLSKEELYKKVQEEDIVKVVIHDGYDRNGKLKKTFVTVEE